MEDWKIEDEEIWRKSKKKKKKERMTSVWDSGRSIGWEQALFTPSKRFNAEKFATKFFLPFDGEG